jgi:hypothetical protein
MLPPEELKRRDEEKKCVRKRERRSRPSAERAAGGR